MQAATMFARAFFPPSQQAFDRIEKIVPNGEMLERAALAANAKVKISGRFGGSETSTKVLGGK
jgi:hypothetical protein